MLALHPSGVAAPLHFRSGAESIADLLAGICLGWTMLRDTARDAGPLLEIGVDGREALLRRPDGSLCVREPSDVSAVCTLVVDIVDALVAAQPHMACLHAAAAEFAGGLVLFPATHRAGKSTLMAALSVAGRRIFADDILPFDLSRSEAVATGCLPRLRLPLPSGVGAASKRTIRRRTVLSDGHYAYLAPGRGREVRHGERLPIRAVVLLDRRAGTAHARLEPAPLDEALQEILVRNTRRDRDATRLLSTFAGLIRDVPVRRLVYSDLADAVSCLQQAFAAEAVPRAPGPSAHTRRRMKRAVPQISPGALRDPLVYGRNPRIRIEQLDASAFLVDPADGSIHRLDALAAGLWSLLEEPISEAELVGVVADAFPGVPRSRIVADLSMLLTGLQASGLVECLSR